MAASIDMAQLLVLVDKHFGNTLKKLGFTFSQPRVEARVKGERYFKFIFLYTSQSRYRNVEIEISNDFELIDYDLTCDVTIHKLPVSGYVDTCFDPEYFYHNLTLYKQPVEYDKYKIEQDKNLLDEVDRVLGNYAKLIFSKDILKVVEGRRWYEGIYAHRDDYNNG